MLYASYEFVSRATAPFHLGALWWQRYLEVAASHRDHRILRDLGAELEAFVLSKLTHKRTEFNMTNVFDSAGDLRRVHQTEVASTPFAKLIRFKRERTSALPKILLVAPMSGHFSTLLAGTVKALVQDHEVFITDWLNPRNIPLSEGRFGFSEYVQHLIKFLRHLGPGVHLMGVCQPTVACMAAAALLAEEKDPCEPASLILLAGPIDTRLNPTRVNLLAQEHSIEWFERNLVNYVPLPNIGAGRRVYPGFVQLMAFMSMNRDRHMQAFKQLKQHRAAGEHSKADAIVEFYKEYFAVMDLPAEFYLETVQKIFQDHELPKGNLKVNNRSIDCSLIRKPFLLTIEGERDDICGIGQTLAAQDICSRMPQYKKTHLLQPGVGHYGVFNGKRWERKIYPVIRDFIQATA
jgi:poly(3-hydroxybutyrate) depolymerase